jgi:stage II sporulation protein D
MLPSLLFLQTIALQFACAEPPTATVEAPPDAAGAAALWYRGETSAAIEEYRRLVDMSPQNTDHLVSLIVLLREAGRVREALAVSQAARDRVPMEHAINQVAAGEVWSGPVTEPATEARAGETARMLFWQGVHAMTADAPRGAVADLFAAAIAAAPRGHYPYAYFFLGLMDAAVGDWSAAQSDYEQALSQDANLTEVFVPLARALWQQGAYREAWDRLERARIAIPWDPEIPLLLAAWEGQRPEITAGGEERAAARRAAATPPRVAIAPEAHEEVPILRVGLVENLRSVFLKTGGPFTVEEVDSGTIVFEDNLSPGAVMHAVTSPGGVTLAVEGIGEVYRGSSAVRLGHHDRSYTTTIFDLTYGHGQFSAGREDRSYRGEIELLPRNGTITVVNRLSVEEYLYSVVPSEMPAWWPEEALAAQAIAARSYTLYPRNRFADRGFDLLSSVASAYYPGATNEHPRTTAAIDATRGLVLRDGGRPLDAVYSANSAGYGEAAGSVWGWPNSLVETSDPLLPPLEANRSPATVYHWITSRPDSYAARPPFSAMSSYRWELLVSARTIETRLAAAGQTVGTVLAIHPGPRGITGRVESVRVVGTEGETVVRRDAIRSRLGGLRSNLFVVSPYLGPGMNRAVSESLGDATAAAESTARPADAGSDSPNASDGGLPPRAPSYFFFQGAGWGHGVGMCQTGAAGMADAGFGAREILAQYYPRNEVVSWY